MTTTDSKTFREAIRRTLAHRAGSNPDAHAIAAATIDTWHQMSARLAPVIGINGVNTLFLRSLHLSSATFEWLAITKEQDDSADLLVSASLLARLADRDTDEAAKASYTLLVTFTELLASMIGESLTKRLLLPVWAPPPSVTEQERNHELQSCNNATRHRSTGT